MRAAVYIYEGTEPIDLATIGVLSMARRVIPEISMFTIARKSGIVETANGLKVLADYSFDSAPDCDVLIITGGPGWVREAESAETLAFIRRYSERAAVASVCTGGMILAATGLLDGHAATTKSEITGTEQSPLTLMRERYPAINAASANIIDCGRIVTGGGVTLCIDMTLYLIERFHGVEAARETARIMEYSAARAANAVRLETIVAKA